MGHQTTQPHVARGLRVVDARAEFDFVMRCCACWSLIPLCGWLYQNAFIATVGIGLSIKSET